MPEIARRPDGSVITPNVQEPHCIHPGGERQPASACSICKDSEAFLYWKRQWDAYVEENPDSEAAQWRRRQDEEQVEPVVYDVIDDLGHPDLIQFHASLEYPEGSECPVHGEVHEDPWFVCIPFERPVL